MFDSAELRVHPTGKAILKLGVKSQGQGHETTFAQIVAEELGIPVTDIKVMEGDTDNTPYGLGTYASRSTPVAGAATAMVSRKLADKAKHIAAHLLEAAPPDIELHVGKFNVAGSPDRTVTIQDVALAAYTNCPDGMEYGLESVHYYDPPNLTYPYGSYVVVVEVDPETGRLEGAAHGGARRLRRAHQPDDRRGPDPRRADRGVRDVVDAVDHLRRRRQLHRLQLHGLPDPHRVGDAQVRAALDGVPSPHHPIGAKGVGESATVGSPAAYVNAVDRRARAPRGTQHRHALAPRPGVGRDRTRR